MTKIGVGLLVEVMAGVVLESIFGDLGPAWNFGMLALGLLALFLACVLIVLEVGIVAHHTARATRSGDVRRSSASDSVWFAMMGQVALVMLALLAALNMDATWHHLHILLFVHLIADQVVRVHRDRSRIAGGFEKLCCAEPPVNLSHAKILSWCGTETGFESRGFSFVVILVVLIVSMSSLALASQIFEEGEEPPPPVEPDMDDDREDRTDDEVTVPAKPDSLVEQVINYEVEPGDSLWSISADVLRSDLGREPTDFEIHQLWSEVKSSNPEFSHNFDLIHPGDGVRVPGFEEYE